MTNEEGGSEVMYKNQRGITLIALAVTIIVMLILTAIGVSTGMSIIKTANLQELSTNMLLVQARAKVAAEKYNFDQDLNNLIGEPIDTSSIAQIQGATDLTYKLGQNELNTMGLRNLNLKSGEYFVVDYGNLDVEVWYLPNGFKYKNNIYYKLSEISQININEEI